MRILTLFEMKKSNSWDFVMLNLFQHLFETLKQVQGDVSKISLYSNFVLLNCTSIYSAFTTTGILNMVEAGMPRLLAG